MALHFSVNRFVLYFSFFMEKTILWLVTKAQFKFNKLNKS